MPFRRSGETPALTGGFIATMATASVWSIDRVTKPLSEADKVFLRSHTVGELAKQTAPQNHPFAKFMVSVAQQIVAELATEAIMSSIHATIEEATQQPQDEALDRTSKAVESQQPGAGKAEVVSPDDLTSGAIASDVTEVANPENQLAVTAEEGGGASSEHDALKGFVKSHALEEVSKSAEKTITDTRLAGRRDAVKAESKARKKQQWRNVTKKEVRADRGTIKKTYNAKTQRMSKGAGIAIKHSAAFFEYATSDDKTQSAIDIALDLVKDALCDMGGKAIGVKLVERGAKSVGEIISKRLGGIVSMILDANEVADATQEGMLNRVKRDIEKEISDQPTHIQIQL